MTLSKDEHCNSGCCDFLDKPLTCCELCVRTVHVDELLHQGLRGESGQSDVMYPTSPSDAPRLVFMFRGSEEVLGKSCQGLVGVLPRCFYESRDPDKNITRPPKTSPKSSQTPEQNNSVQCVRPSLWHAPQRLRSLSSSMSRGDPKPGPSENAEHVER